MAVGGGVGAAAWHGGARRAGGQAAARRRRRGGGLPRGARLPSSAWVAREGAGRPVQAGAGLPGWRRGTAPRGPRVGSLAQGGRAGGGGGLVHAGGPRRGGGPGARAGPAGLRVLVMTVRAPANLGRHIICQF
jgi:hypothetical protein